MAPTDPAREDISRLRRCLSDLIGITALPAVWASGGQKQITNILLDALLSTLPLSFAFVHLEDPYGGPTVEFRMREPLDGVVKSSQLNGILNTMLGTSPSDWPATARLRIGGADLSVACARLGFDGEIGSIAVGSQRSGFPDQVERLVLDVAVNQAAVGLQQVRLLNEQRRLARELDLRVEQRTRELAIAHERLKKSEYDSRLIVDSIPGLVALLSPTGEVEVVNRQLYEYFGQSLEELRHWGSNDTIHPEDLPHVIEVFSRSIATGSPYEILQRFRRSDGVYRWFTNRGFPVRDADNRVSRWCVLLTDIDERVRAEEALRSRERNLNRIIDTIPALVWCNLPDGPNEYLSTTWHEYTGLTPEEAHGWGWQKAFHPDDLPTLMTRWGEVLAAGVPGEVEARLRRHDGEYRWFLIRVKPFRDETGEILRWYGTSTDIEDRKRAEETLESRGRDLKLIIDTIPTLSWSTDPTGAVDFLSRSWLDFTGLSAKEATGFGWSVAIHPEDAAGLLQYWQGALESGSPVDVEARLRRYDGVYRWFLFRASALRDESGKIIKWYGTNIDIEDRKRAEEELRRKEAFLTKAQRLSLSGSFSWRVDTEEVTFSNEAYRIFGFEPGTAVTPARIASRIQADDRAILADKIGRPPESGGDYTFAVRLQMPDGSIKHLLASAQYTFNEHGVREYIGALQDVTARHLTEESLDRARSELAHVSRITSFSALTASIAHEINQPLSGIITNASTCLRMLNAEPPNIEGARETARRTIRDGNRVSDVIARLRALFSKKEIALESMDLNDAVREVLAMSSNDMQRHRVAAQSELAEDIPLVAGDRIQLQQVVLNLLRNALEAMSDVNDRPRRLLIRTNRDENGHVRLSIRDTGVGLDAQTMDKLFDSFYTTKSGGMGIGLSVSRSIIEKHHGRLWAERNDGPGATFAFSIPVRPEHVPTADLAARTK